jgi:hypothetical protein
LKNGAVAVGVDRVQIILQKHSCVGSTHKANIIRQFIQRRDNESISSKNKIRFKLSVELRGCRRHQRVVSRDIIDASEDHSHNLLFVIVEQLCLYAMFVAELVVPFVQGFLN